MQELDQKISNQAEAVRAENACPAKLLDRLVPQSVLEVKKVFRAQGLKGVFHRYGWKIIAAAFCYYLIRDSILYILIPYLVAKGLIF